MRVTFDYAGNSLISFDDDSYRWLIVKRFAWDGAGDDPEVLAALVGHRRYRDHYAGPNSHEEDAGNIHGPYWLTAITPAKFMSIGPDGATALVEEFCGLFGCPPRPEVREEIGASVLSHFDGAACYRLGDLPDSIHEWGFVLMEFRELVVISREAGEVLSVVMAID